MALYQRSVFWVILTVGLLVGLFIGSQLWLQYGAVPSTGVSMSFNMNVAPGAPNATLETWVGKYMPGRWSPQIDLPDSITESPAPRFRPMRMPGAFAIEPWLEGAFPDASTITVNRTESFDVEEEGAGVRGTVSQVDLVRADGSFDPIFFVEFQTREAPERWGMILRGRYGPSVRFDDQWELTARPFLWWRNNLRLRKEITFTISVFVNFEESGEGEEFWLDRVPTSTRMLPDGAVPASAESVAEGDGGGTG